MSSIQRYRPEKHPQSDGFCEEEMWHDPEGEYVRWDDVKGIVDAKERLESACDLYVRWYGTGEPEMGGGAMAYEMVCFIRQALAALEGKTAS